MHLRLTAAAALFALPAFAQDLATGDVIKSTIAGKTQETRDISLATLEEVADAAVWLASPLADYVTGQVLAIDGGLTLASALGGAFAAAAGPALQAAARRSSPE